MSKFATVVKKGVFDSAHSNVGFGEGHKCARIHGHTFSYEVHVRSKINRETGLSLDFGIVKSIMKEKVEDVLDHRYINDVDYFKGNKIPPSAENIAIFIFETLQYHLEDKAEVTKVILNETPTSALVITKDDL